MSPVMSDRTCSEALDPAGGELHVSSLIVHVRPEQLDQLRTWLAGLKGVEVPVDSPEGKLVVLSESESERDIADLMQAIGDRPGVLNTAMIYHEIIDQKEDPT